MSSAPAPVRVCLASLDDGNRLPLAAVHDALDAANELLGHGHYLPCVALIDAPWAGDAGGCELSAELPAEPPFAVLFLSATQMPAARGPQSARLARLLERTGTGAVMAGVGTGAAWLAEAGLLRGYRCTLQAEHLDAFLAVHADAYVSYNVFEIDRDRLTCAGGLACLDMTITWLGQRHGEWLAQQLTARFGLERLRTSEDRQHARATVPGHSSPKLAEALSLMQANIREPLSTQDIAELVGVSRRQLERLFRQHLDTLPSRWYLQQRLELARKLLQQSPHSILQVGLSCGFASAAHFSNAYRTYFGRTPRDERGARVAAWRDGAATTPADAGKGTP